jgi:hypothetical protein
VVGAITAITAIMASIAAFLALALALALVATIARILLLTVLLARFVAVAIVRFVAIFAAIAVAIVRFVAIFAAIAVSIGATVAVSIEATERLASVVVSSLGRQWTDGFLRVRILAPRYGRESGSALVYAAEIRIKRLSCERRAQILLYIRRERGPDGHHGSVPVGIVLRQDPHPPSEAHLLGDVPFERSIVGGDISHGELAVGELEGADGGVWWKPPPQGLQHSTQAPRTQLKPTIASQLVGPPVQRRAGKQSVPDGEQLLVSLRLRAWIFAICGYPLQKAVDISIDRILPGAYYTVVVPVLGVWVEVADIVSFDPYREWFAAARACGGCVYWLPSGV